MAIATFLQYWMVDPGLGQVTVLHLAEAAYKEVGVFKGEEAIASREVPEISITVNPILGCGSDD